MGKMVREMVPDTVSPHPFRGWLRRHRYGAVCGGGIQLAGPEEVEDS
jgi:hypothetical protein